MSRKAPLEPIPRIHKDPVIYSAAGRICGTYTPDPGNFIQGTFLTEDGLQVPAKLGPKVVQVLLKQSGLVKLPQVWNCYPQVDPPSFLLTKLKTGVRSSEEHLTMKGVNKFRIVGQVKKINGNQVTVLIKRNSKPLKGQSKSFNMVLTGNIPEEAVGEFWRFNVRREGWIWHIRSGMFLAESKTSSKKKTTKKKSPTEPKPTETATTEAATTTKTTTAKKTTTKTTKKKATAASKRSLSVKILDTEFQAVEEYAQQSGKSKTDVIRELIKNLPTYQDQDE